MYRARLHLIIQCLHYKSWSFLVASLHQAQEGEPREKGEGCSSQLSNYMSSTPGVRTCLVPI